jgi:glycosyltransferase involved in cell wall biosynthesis
VIIPTRDRPEALHACLESLAGQQYPSALFEVIVVDDGGEVPAAPVVAEYHGRLQVSLRWQTRAGPAAARNQGVMFARGTYIAFIDDDCLAEPGWLAGLASGLRAHPCGTLLGGAVANPFPDDACAEVGELILKVLLDRFHPESGGVYFFRSANMALRRDEFTACGAFDASFETAEDREFCDRWLHRGGSLVQVPSAVVWHVSPLTLRAFLNRHYRYGRGAYRFHHIRKQRGSGSFRVEFLWFYLFVLQECLASRRLVVRKVALVFLWQACSVLGFVAELAHHRLSRVMPAGSVR